MSHFFLPSQSDSAHGASAAMNSGITELFISSNGLGRFGVSGGGPDGAPLVIKVWRGAAVVSEGKFPQVKINKVSSDAATHIQVYSASGLKEGDEIYGMLSAGARWTSALTIRVLTTSAGDVMSDWAKHYSAGEPMSDRFLYKDAVPYLALDDKTRGLKMTKLSSDNIGGGLTNIHGLALHATSGTSARTAFEMACFGCIQTWLATGASAHFGISGDGTIVQFIPVNRVAYAQSNPGNSHWISVELDNDGHSAMTGQQLISATALFHWICNNFNIPAQVATGCLYPKTPYFDKTTTSVCSGAHTETTTDPFEAVMSRGLSCHWWLEASKGAHSHACPGLGVLGQIASLV